MTYTEEGSALFYCPRYWASLGHRLWYEMSMEERLAYLKEPDHLEGHDEWTFSWGPGAWHIEHDANGGVPHCSRCGERLVLVGGLDPGHLR